MPAAVKPCQECGVRAKARPQHRCRVCLDRRLPIEDRVELAEDRRALVPADLLPKRIDKAWYPPGQAWCGACASFVDLVEYNLRRSRCKPCESRDRHARMIRDTYGIDLAEYRRLKRMQGGRCAICRQRPRTERLAVDHDHGSGAVRGLLCTKCNHGILGNAHDSLAILKNAVAYLERTPSSGTWLPPLPTPHQARNLSITELGELWRLAEAANAEDPAPF